MSINSHLTSIVSGAPQDSGLLGIAEACRASNLTAAECAPELYSLFPTSTANELGGTLVMVWGCELASADLTSALASCMNNGNPAYTAAQISAAVTASMSLVFQDVAHVPVMYGGAINNQLMMIGLSTGDLTTITPSEAAEFLLISCMPGDYTPTPGSLIAALQNSYGISVGTMAQNPAADYRSNLNCWISQNLSTYTQSQLPYKQIICFESTGANAVANIPNLFTALKTYIPTPPAIPNTGPTIISALLSTGSAGADPSAVLTALFNGCWSLMTTAPGYNITCFRIDVYPATLAPQLVTVFDQLKHSHSNKSDVF